MTNPQKFRSLEEVRRYLQEQTQELQLDQQIVDKATKQLARHITAAEPRIMDIGGEPKRNRRMTLDVNFPMVKVPQAQQLATHYALAEKLSEQYKALVNTENEIKLNFGRETGSQYKEVIGQFTKLRQQVAENLRKLLHALAQVAAGHAPKEYLQFVQGLADELATHSKLECDSIKTMTYPALDKAGKLIFGGYIILQNAVNDQGKTLPVLYIVIKWTVGEAVEVFIENEFIVPTLLESGTLVKNMREAAKVVDQQLSLEGFATQIGTLPVSMQISDPVGGMKPEAFSAKDYIRDIRGAKDSLIFTLNTEEPEKVEEIQTQIYMELKSLLKKKRSTRISVRPHGNTLTFSFSNLEHAGGIHPHDLEWLEDKYKLSDTALRRICNEINEDKTR